MVPEDHLLRKVDRAVDFSFIYDLCAPLYCSDNGAGDRPGGAVPNAAGRGSVRDQVRGTVGGRDQLQHRVQVVLRAGLNRQGAGCAGGSGQEDAWEEALRPGRGGSPGRRNGRADAEHDGHGERPAEPEGFHYSEHRTVDSRRNVNVHIEPANINDVTPLPEIPDEIQMRMGKLPKSMGLDAGCHSAGIAHLLEKKGIQGVIGCRRHTHRTHSYGKCRFRCVPASTLTSARSTGISTGRPPPAMGMPILGDSKTCKACPRRTACFGASMARRRAERHAWQDALDDVTALSKSEKGRRIYGWKKETIERSFVETKENHGLRHARMLGIRNMRKQSLLTAAVQNIKRLVASHFSSLTPA